MSRPVLERLRQEHGFSLVVAVCTMGLLVMVAAVAVQQAVGALQGASYQAKSKRALHAADAAIDAAIFRLNRADLGGTLNIDALNPGQVVAQNCIVSVGSDGTSDMVPMPEGTVPDLQGRRWCPATDPESVDDNATFQYRVSEMLRVASGDCGGLGTLSLDRDIVAVGSSGDVRRRVKARMRASVSLLSGAAVQSGSTEDPMQMSGTARVLGTVQSNHDIVGTGTNVISGRAIPGPGTPPHTVTGVVAAGSTTAACQRFLVPPVQQGTAPTSNNNPATIPQRCLNALMVVTGCTLPLLGTSGGVEWDASQRTLRVWGNGVATLTGATYSLCRLRLEGQGILQIASSSPVTRIFLDSPENCGGVTGPGQVVADGSARIVNCHPQTQPQTLQLYAVGSSTPTTQTIAGAGSLSAALQATLCGVNVPGLGTPMVLYAPQSAVQLGGSAAISGQVVGNTVQMSGSSVVEPVNALVNINQLGASPTLPLYQPTAYVECSGRRTFVALPANDPAQGC